MHQKNIDPEWVFHIPVNVSKDDLTTDPMKKKGFASAVTYVITVKVLAGFAGTLSPKNGHIVRSRAPEFFHNQ